MLCSAHNAGVRITALKRALKVVILSLPLLAPEPPAQASQRSAQTAAPARPAASDLVDINRCSADELLTLPGITRIWADRIVRFRPYRTKADLEEQGIIPADLYTRIKDSIIAHRSKQ